MYALILHSLPTATVSNAVEAQLVCGQIGASAWGFREPGEWGSKQPGSRKQGGKKSREQVAEEVI